MSSRQGTIAAALSGLMMVLALTPAACGSATMKSGGESGGGGPKGEGGSAGMGTGGRAGTTGGAGGGASGSPGVGGAFGGTSGASSIAGTTGSGGVGGAGGTGGGAGGSAGVLPYRISAGGSAACALGRDGRVLCWGLNQFGQLGQSTTAGDRCPSGGFDYTCKATPTFVAGLTDVVDLDVGQWHVCAVKSDGSLWCWGDNRSQQLGHSGGDATCTDPSNGATTSCNPTPQVVTGFPSGTKIVRAAAGISHTCAISNAGDVYCWGDNQIAQLGVAPTTTPKSATPLKVSGLSSQAVEITVSIDHLIGSCARLLDTTVWCWGHNDYGALGRDPAADPSTSVSHYHTPLPIFDAQQSPLSSVGALQAGGGGGCALKTDGTVWCWGHNGQGTLGNSSSDVNVHAVPTRVTLALPQTLTALSRKDFTALALDRDGFVWAWGRNNYASIGDGTVTGDSCGTTCKGTPVKLPTLSGVAAIAIGEVNAFAIRADGSVWAWGPNDFGTLGHAAGTMGDTICGASATGVCNPLPTRVVLP